LDTFIATDFLKGSAKVGRDSYLTLRLDHGSSAILRFDLKDYRAGTDGLGEQFLELLEGGFAEALQIEAHTKFGGAGALGNVLKTARFLQGEPRARLFDLDADFQKKGRARFQDVFQAREAFRKNQELL
jgi:hypothetical protein